MSFETESSLTFAHTLRVIGFTILALCLIAYALFQARNFLQGPELSLTTEPPAVSTERMVFLEGIARNITSLTLNGKPIFTDENGIFRKALVLENGYTIMTLYAEDRFGRKTSLERSFVYQP